MINVKYKKEEHFNVCHLLVIIMSMSAHNSEFVQVKRSVVMSQLTCKLLCDLVVLVLIVKLMVWYFIEQKGG
jgi:hypothetical protein